MAWRSWGSNLRCRFGVHCDHKIDEDHVTRRTHEGREREGVIIYQAECCRCLRTDFGETKSYGWGNHRREQDDR